MKPIDVLQTLIAIRADYIAMAKELAAHKRTLVKSTSATELPLVQQLDQAITDLRTICETPNP